MSEENTQKEIEDSLKVCREIQSFLRREKKENENGVSGMNPGTRSEIDQILKNLSSLENQPDEKTIEKAVETTVEMGILSPEKKQMPPKVAVQAETVSAVKVTKAASPVSEEPTSSVPDWKPITITELDSEPDSKPDPEPDSPSEEISGTLYNPIKDIGDIDEEYNETHPFLRAALRVLICIMLALLLAIFITKFVAHHTSVEGSSMEPTLQNENQLIVENVSYYFHDPKRFDVIVFPYSEDVNYIKRVIGLPGERIQIIDGMIYINGELLEENYGREDIIEDPGIAGEEMLLGADEYFVLGDNRNASVDSRKPEVGTVKRGDILGRAWLCFYPLDKAGVIE